MVFVYFIAVAAASALVGVLVREIMADQSLVVGFQGELMLAVGVACAYAALQCLYMTALRILVPFRDYKPYLVDSFGQLAAVILLLYLADMRVPLPHPRLEPVEGLLYLGAFGVVHLAVKAATFYSALRSHEGSPFAALGWLTTALLCGWGSWYGLNQWIVETEAQRPQVSDTISAYTLEHTRAVARRMPEGAVLNLPLILDPTEGLTMRWGMPPEDTSELDRIFVTAIVESGVSKKTFEEWISVKEAGWHGWHIPQDQLPLAATACQIWWRRERIPRLQRSLGIQPVVQSDTVALLSGPEAIEYRQEDSRPNLVLIMIDGLAEERISALGYDRATTPSLDRMIERSLVYENGYATAKSAAEVYDMLLTAPPLASMLAKEGYATGAFTEGDGPVRDLITSNAATEGFHTFNDKYGMNAGGADVTIEAALRWIEEHKLEKFFAFIRLRDLEQINYRDTYPQEFIRTVPPKRGDVYDAALWTLDHALGKLIRHLQNYSARHDTVVFITAPYGQDPDSRAQPPITLKVPLVIWATQFPAQRNLDSFQLDVLPPTLLRLAGAPLTEGLQAAPLRGVLLPTTPRGAR